MMLSLADKDRCSMLFIGGELNFTYDSPGPIEVDFGLLTLEQKTQIFYNWRRGVLAVDNDTDLKSFSQPAPQATPQPAKVYGAPTGNQSTAQPVDVEEALRAREVRLRAILREPINVIKSSLSNLTGPELHVILSLEKQLKNRKKLLSTIEEVIDQRNKTVGRSVGNKDVGTKIFDPRAQSLDSSMDVIDSDMKEVMLIPSDKELTQEDG